MYKHILVPTDGSALSARAIEQAIGLAKFLGAKVTGMTVSIPFHVFALDPLMVSDTATLKGCDLILMASHGRKGVAGLVLGSETHKVLIHSKIPVLVCR